MNRYKLAVFAVTALVCGAAGEARAAPDLIVNGDFATPSVGSGYSLFSSIPGWTVNQDAIEVDYTPILGMACYTASCQSAEVDANTFDTISQTVNGLHPGSQYTLSWGYGDRPGSGPQELDVTMGGSPVTSDFGTGTTGLWTPNSFVITATATSEVLSFAAVDTSGIGGAPGAGNEVDSVSLVGVPEPASMVLLGSGMLGLGLFRRRHR
jgi:PEP-CTERM motif